MIVLHWQIMASSLDAGRQGVRVLVDARIPLRDENRGRGATQDNELQGVLRVVLLFLGTMTEPGRRRHGASKIQMKINPSICCELGWPTYSKYAQRKSRKEDQESRSSGVVTSRKSSMNSGRTAEFGNGIEQPWGTV
jgi:hypothetical protein